MGALNIRDIGDDRKAALDVEAKAQGVSVSELVRRYIDEGVERSRSSRAHREWLKESRNGLTFEAKALERDGPSLARYRRVLGAGEGR